MEVAAQIGQLLNATVSPDSGAVHTATEALDRLSQLPDFPYYLLSISAGGENQGQKIAAATYLKNFTRKNVEGHVSDSKPKVSKEFKDQLLRALLQSEPAVVKVLVEVFRVIVVAEFVKQNWWPELVPDLRAALENSNLISGANSQWNTVNALRVLHALVRPFQYFLEATVSKEPVPPQLELIAKDILVPLLTLFHQIVQKALGTHGMTDVETENLLLIVCKCMYFTVRSHMPSALVPLLPSFCHDLIGILDSLSFDCVITPDNGYQMRLKTGKRSLRIFCCLITRHRKYSDKLMPDIVKCALNVVKYSKNISKLDFLSERIISLSFDVISHVLETGPGWRLVSPHFSYLLDSAIFPALVMNEKDISEWEEDAEEYIRKNLPSDLEEISGWREDLFTARKSAINLLGVISVSKGPQMGTSTNASSASSKRKKGEKKKRNNQTCSIGELLVLPFLSKFPIPSDANPSQTRIMNDYFGVLMAYAGLLDFLREQEPTHSATLVRSRLLPLYNLSVGPPLVAAANWVLGELASCLPEDMSADVYSSLLKALAMPDSSDTSCYPVRVSAAAAIVALLDNDYPPPEWLPLLQVVIGRIGRNEEENSILFQLLSSVVEAGNENVAVHIPYIISSLVVEISKRMPPGLEPWPQMVENGFAALAVMAQIWENDMSEELEEKESSQNFLSGQATIGRAFSDLLQQAWLAPMHISEDNALPPPSCLDSASTLLRSIMLSVTGSNVILELKVPELLLVWADLIADWHAWEESEDMSVFECIKEVVSLHSKYGLKNFIVGQMPSPPAPPVPKHSVIEGIGTFISEATLQYPSATWRACSCIHLLLHVPSYSSETENVKQSLAAAFCQATFSRFREVKSKPGSLWKPLLLAISSCYLCSPEVVESTLEKDGDGGFETWLAALGLVSTNSFKPGLSRESEIKLIAVALAKVVERLLILGKSGALLRECFTSLMETSARFNEVEEDNDEDAEEDMDEEDDDGEIEDDDEDEDSEDDEHEETEEEFLNRYAEAALALENGSVIEEGDIEDEDQEMDFERGCLEEIDLQEVVTLLVKKYHPIVIERQEAYPPELISRFVEYFPQCKIFFQHYLKC
ncbi:importin beta-like SAD2 homolog isoform X2 [Rosa chinensis]|uniref:importin beta-like SAD2 homolog isoform X2 n=1 Tax=Rosa chinensis TaxID=74649 RepID=UPI000D087772|nr:importin beta-like SAD2 homolog isoform X2 [Rosa chinensis]